MSSQPMATATTGTRLMKAEALETGSRLMPQLQRPKAPRLTQASRNISAVVNSQPQVIGGPVTRRASPGRKNTAPAATCRAVRDQGG